MFSTIPARLPPLALFVDPARRRSRVPLVIALPLDEPHRTPIRFAIGSATRPLLDLHDVLNSSLESRLILGNAT
jgi:hypothetical protein